MISAFLRLARPKQWSKGAFCFLGAVYSQKLLGPAALGEAVIPALCAFAAFGFASSGCYVFNDLRDVEADRAHPRKRRRPLASGEVSPAAAAWFGMAMFVLAAAAVLLAPRVGPAAFPLSSRELLGGCVVLYVLNTLLYTAWWKHAAVMDVMSLAAGFVLRVLGGCAAVGVEPSSWLLNCTFFLSMFLALGKRLGERRALGELDAAAARSVQEQYTTDLLRMATVVTAVATLLSYSAYVTDQAARYTHGFNLLWLTMLPATFGLLRGMVMVERGLYDDPTELATRDRPFQASAALFGLITLALMAFGRHPAP
ncbi:MAG: UbiA prenyltransferase family protein [Phycisphaerales bacterium]|nr:UbiA prenyltransferase family protein [Phycisphaerales bacterium]